MILLAAILAFVAAALGVMGLLALLTPAPNPHVVRLRQLGAVAGIQEAADSTAVPRRVRLGTRLQSVVELLGRLLVSRKRHAQSKWSKLLVRAGYRKPNAVFAFQGYQLLLTLLLPGAFLLVAPYLKQWSGAWQLAALFGLAAVGFFGPHLWLLQRIKLRQQEIFEVLPNALDLMVVSVEAGLGLDAAIQRLAKEQQFTKQALSEEFQIVSQETRAGRPRSEALLAMKERVGLAELASLIVVLVQADKMGTGVARSLRVHADGLRTKRRHRAEERAQKIPVKMVFALIMLIMPATMLVLLGPSYILLFKALAGLKR